MKISIVIPTFKEEHAIGARLKHLKDSLTMQNEIIVSDGRSPDRTAEIAGQYADQVVIFAGEKHTPARGRNDGAKRATGKYLLFLDADSYLPSPDSVLRQCVERFEKDPTLLGITLPQRALPEVETWADRISFGIVNMIGRCMNNLLHIGEGAGKFMMVRKSAYDRVGGFREDLATREDGDFFYRLSRIGRTISDPTFFVYHGARRAHQLGWARLWWIWTINTLSFFFFNHAFSKEWTPMR